MGRSRTANTDRLRTFMGIAAALWLVGAIAAVTDGDTLMAVSWFCLAAFGALSAGGGDPPVPGYSLPSDRSVGGGVAISMGVFIAD
jgi:hypothetical protein